MKSLHSRQLIHEKRVETEEAEKDRELLDNLKIEIDHYNDVPDLGEDESRSRASLQDNTKQKQKDTRSNTSTTATMVQVKITIMSMRTPRLWVKWEVLL